MSDKRPSSFFRSLGTHLGHELRYSTLELLLLCIAAVLVVWIFEGSNDLVENLGLLLVSLEVFLRQTSWR